MKDILKQGWQSFDVKGCLEDTILKGVLKNHSYNIEENGDVYTTFWITSEFLLRDISIKPFRLPSNVNEKPKNKGELPQLIYFDKIKIS